MPSGNQCFYQKCTNTKKSHPDLTFHRFPENKERLTEWIQRSGCDAAVDEDHSKWKNRLICSIHFNPSDFKCGHRPLLKENAVPKDFEAVGQGPPSDNISDTLKDEGHYPHASNIHEIKNSRFNDSIVAILKKKLNQAHNIIKKLRRQNVCIRRRISRYQKKFNKKSNISRLISAIKDVINNPEKLFLIEMQIRHLKRTSWSDKEKKFALSVYQRSSKCYKLLRKEYNMALPCVTLIRQWINELQICTGINPAFFAKLSEKVDSMNEREKDCVLMWDELALKELLEYDLKNDRVDGFVDLASQGRTSQVANTALVFMVRGLLSSWKQPISFCLSRGPVKASLISVFIKECVENLQSVGLRVRFMVCDQASTNRSAFTSLGISQDSCYYIHNDSKIFCGYDVPHLVKGVRNTLLKTDLVLDEELISLDAIRELVKLEKNNNCKASCKMTERHLNPNNFEKMNVKLAVQLFSHSNYASLMTGVESGELIHPASIPTAGFCENMNRLFDCLNSRSAKDSNPFRAGLSDSRSFVENCLRESLEWLEKLKLKNGAPIPPSIRNLHFTIRSILSLWTELRKENVLYLLTSHLNQDPLENLFGTFRESLGCNHNPSAKQMRYCMQHSMLVNINKPPKTGNCEDDRASLLLNDLSSSNLPVDENNNTNVECNINAIVINTSVGAIESEEHCPNENSSLVFELEHELENNFDVIKAKSLEECSIRYVAGYLAHRCLKKFDCAQCLFHLLKDNQNLETSSEVLIFWKAFLTKDESQLGNLKPPTDEFFQIISAGFKIFSQIIKPTIHKVMPRKRFNISFEAWVLKNHLEWTQNVCQKHYQFIVEVFGKMLIYYNLKWKSWDIRDGSSVKRSAKNAQSSSKLKKLKHQ